MALVTKILLAAGALAIALGLCALVYKPVQAPTTIPAMQTSLATTTLRLGTTTIVAEVADTDASRELGLGNRTALPDGAGMWFVFDQDGFYSFWMKDTLIPLDMLWVAADGTVVTIAHEVEPSSYPQSYVSSAPARYVLELPGGYATRHGIAEGQKIVVQ